MVNTCKVISIDILTLKNINCSRHSSAMNDVNEILVCFFVRCPSSWIVVLSSVVKCRRRALICWARFKSYSVSLVQSFTLISNSKTKTYPILKILRPKSKSKVTASTHVIS
jgi:hypothetical protein